MYASKLLTLSTLFIISLSFAQQNDSIAQANLEHGKKIFFYREFDKSISIFQKSLDYYTSVGNRSKMAQCYNLLSKAHMPNNKFEEALSFANMALELSRQVDVNDKLEEANALDNIGTILRLTRQLDEAQKNHNDALEIRLKHLKNDNFNLVRSYHNLGKTYHRQGKYKGAMDTLNLSLNLLRDDTPRTKILKANIYETFGQIYYDNSDYDTSLLNFQKTYQFAKEVYKEYNSYFSEVYNQISLIYTQKKEFHASQEYLHKALSISIANSGIDKHPSQARIHFNLGTAYLDGGLKEKALFHTKKSLDIGIKYFGEDSFILHFPYSQMGRILGNEQGIPFIEKSLELLNKTDNRRNKIIASFSHTYIAQIHFDLENYSKALEYSKNALDIRLEVFGKNNAMTIESLIDVAKILLQQSEYDKALDYNNQAILANDLSGFNEQINIESIKPVDYLDNKLQIDATKTQADIFLALYHKTGDETHLNDSNRYYKNAESLISLMRNTKRNYNDKIEYSNTVKSIYAKIIETTLLLDNHVSGSVADSTFYFSEKSKANVIRELSKNTKAKTLSNVNSEILELEKDIDWKIAKLTSNIVEEISNETTDTTRVYALEGQLFDLTKRKDSLENQIEKNFPKYYELKYEKHIIDIHRLQEKLDKNTTFVEFLKSDNTLFTYIISKNNFSVQQLQVNNLNKTIKTLNSSISQKETGTYLEAATTLYDQLIKPIKTHLVGTKLIIVPDEILWDLQFDLLIDAENTKTKAKPNYLLYDYAISYANSASMLFESHDTKTPSNFLNECLAFSYTSNDSIVSNSEVDLPGSREEIKQLSSVFKGKYLYDNDASEANFKKNVSLYNLIHLALHAEIDSLNPEIIKIRFSELTQNEKEDNILYGHELYTVNIPADLVVLSACNTGVGKINNGEGILSVGNAFQYAGAESLMLSRWSISDETTPEVMKYFYENIKKGMSKSEALQHAKMEYLKSSDVFTSAPYYWGSFYILGNTNAVELSPTSSNLYYYLGGFLLLAGVFFYLKRKRKTS